MEIILWGTLASFAAGLMTGVGALPVLMKRTVSRRWNDTMLGFAAGVMLSASFFSLIIPGIEVAQDCSGSVLIGALVVGAGIGLGAFALWLLNETIPHEHFAQGPEGADPGSITRIWLFVFAITLHNFPEGLAVGVGFGTGDIASGMSLAIGIGLQNLPEGLAVAVALRGLGYGRWFSFNIALLTGLVEPVGGLLGVTLVTLFAALLPWGLAFAAGAMIYVISHEIIPETHRRGNQAIASAGLITGLVVMMVLDVTLG